MIDAVAVKDAPAAQADASLAELTARRRGRIRRYLFQHPRAMDAVVVACYLLLVSPTAVESVLDGVWAAPVLLAAAAASLLFRRSHPVPVIVVVAVLEAGLTLLHPWGSNVAAGL